MAYEDDDYEDESDDFTEETTDDWEPYQPPEEEPPPPPPPEPDPEPIAEAEPEPDQKPYQVVAADTGTRTDATYVPTPAPAKPEVDDWEPYKPPATAAAPAGAKPAGDDWEPYTPDAEQPKRGFGERVAAGWEGGYGTQPTGFSLETMEKFPWLKPVSPLVAGADAAMRSIPGVVGAVMGGAAATAEAGGMSRTNADRLQRDLKIVGEGLLVEPGMGPAGSAMHGRAVQRSSVGPGYKGPPPPEPPPEPIVQPGVKNADWTGKPQDVPPPPPPAQGVLPGFGDGARQPNLPLEEPVPPKRPGPSVQPELPFEPPVVDAEGQYGFNITAPDIHSRPGGPPTSGVAKEATPPSTGVEPGNTATYAKRGEPDPRPHSAVSQGLAADAEGRPPGPASGINVMQPGQGDPTIRHALGSQAETPKPPQKTFEKPGGAGQNPDWQGPPAPIPRNQQLVPSPRTTQGVTEPTVPDGHVRMYKADPRSATDFTTDRKVAEQYGPVRYVDVPEGQARAQFTPGEPGKVVANKIWEAPNYQQRLRSIEEVATEPVGQGRPPPTAEPPTRGGPTEPPAGGMPPTGVRMAPPGLETRLQAQQAAAPKPPAPRSREITLLREPNGVEHKLKTSLEMTLKDAMGKYRPREGLMGELSAYVEATVLKTIGNMPVYVVPTAELQKYRKGNAVAFYNRQQNHIVVNDRYLREPETLRHAIIHEGIHGVTAHAIIADPKVRAAIRSIMNDVTVGALQKRPGVGSRTRETNYAFTNEREFLAEAFSNPVFQKMLSELEISERTARRLGLSPKASVWDSIVETVRRILKVPEGRLNALEATMRVTEQSMAINEGAKAEMMASHGTTYRGYGTDALKKSPDFGEHLDMAPGGKGTVKAFDASGTEKTFTGATVAEAAAAAKRAGYRDYQIYNSDMTRYSPPRATATPAQTTAQTPANTAQNRANAPPGAPPPAAPPSRLTAALAKLPEGKYRDAVQTAAGKVMDIGHEIQMAVSPMTRGSETAMAAAKDFANNLRLNRQEWAWADEKMEKNFTPERRRAMWDAADAESVAQQTGKPAKNGLASLRPEERAAIQEVQGRSKAAWEEARRLDMVSSEGLPAYTPRMLVNLIGGTGERGPAKLDPIGLNLRTKTGQMKHREHMTAAETEAAGKAKFGEQAELARDIRTLPLATGRLEDAIAGRKLIDGIREAGRRTGDATVVEGSKPAGSPHKWFTIDHPSMKVWRSSKDNAGNTTFKEVPLYVRGDFEGPLRSVLSTESGKLYQGAMELKGKTMSVIMNSPLIHNAVEWGRAMPAMPGKVLTFKVYFEGNRAKKDLPTMREAIGNGLVPIGGRGYMQDINAIMEAPNMKPGRSWTAKALAYVPSKVSPEAGLAIKRGVDKAGNFWHNTMLWDRVGDLQVGLYTNFMADLMAKGIDRQTASRTAAHWANRYAGALPQEAMSSAAQKVANMALFSRSFTLGNLGAMKDMVNGLPRDVRAQISRDIGKIDPKAEGAIKSMAKRKAIAIIALDVGLMYIGNSLLQSGINVLRGDKTLDEEGRGYAERLAKMAGHVQEHPASLLQPFHLMEGLSSTSENEPGKRDRILIGYTADGQAIYARNPAGKIGEEFTGWAGSPLDMFKRKMSTTARPVWQLMSNDKGFGRKVYDPQAQTVDEKVKNVLRVIEHIAMAQTPEMQVKAAKDLATGEGDPKLNTLQTFGPVAGVTFSRGAPGGPAMGELYRAREKHQYNVNEALPEIRRMIKRGETEEAIDKMNELGIAPALQRFYIRTTENPETRLTPRAQKDFERYATPDEKERFRRQLERQGIR